MRAAYPAGSAHTSPTGPTVTDWLIQVPKTSFLSPSGDNTKLDSPWSYLLARSPLPSSTTLLVSGFPEKCAFRHTLWTWILSQVLLLGVPPMIIATINHNYQAPHWFPGGSDGKASAYNAGDPGSIPGLGRSPGEGNGNPLQYSWWKISWMEEPGRLQSTGSQKVRCDWATSLSSECGHAMKQLQTEEGRHFEVILTQEWMSSPNQKVPQSSSQVLFLTLLGEKANIILARRQGNGEKDDGKRNCLE